MESGADGDGRVETMSAKKKRLVQPTSVNGGGAVSTYQPRGKDGIILSATPNGGMVNVFNKTGERIVNMYADDYGNGVVGAYNRKGRGRTLQPGP